MKPNSDILAHAMGNTLIGLSRNVVMNGKFYLTRYVLKQGTTNMYSSVQWFRCSRLTLRIFENIIRNSFEVLRVFTPLFTVKRQYLFRHSYESHELSAARVKIFPLHRELSMT